MFSVSRSHLKRVIAYVRNQKQHHASGNLWPEWEETDSEYVPEPPPTDGFEDTNLT